MAIHGLTTFLWFDNDALEAAEFYVSLFPEGKLGAISHYGEGAAKPAGTVLVAEFELFGQKFGALNGGPEFPHTEAVSFQVSCDTQDEIDRLWNGIVDAGGEESQCGWCKDKWGVSWQITSGRLAELLSSPDEQVAAKAFAAMLKMKKIVIAELEEAIA